MKALILPLLFVVACFGNESTEFPEGLEPLGENIAPLPDEPGMSMERGDDDDIQWVHARARIELSAAEVWAALKDPVTVVNTWSTDSQSYELGVAPEYEHSMEVHYFRDEFVDVEWDELWRYGTVEGVPEAPELAIVRYQKIFGTVFIRLLEGSFVVIPITDSSAELQMIQRVEATRASHEDIEDSFQHYFDAIVGAGNTSG